MTSKNCEHYHNHDHPHDHHHDEDNINEDDLYNKIKKICHKIEPDCQIIR